MALRSGLSPSRLPTSAGLWTVTESTLIPAGIGGGGAVMLPPGRPPAGRAGRAPAGRACAMADPAARSASVAAPAMNLLIMRTLPVLFLDSNQLSADQHPTILIGS